MQEHANREKGISVSASKLHEMKRGWFVGGFAPTALSTEACEVAVKQYMAADREPLRKHQVATEITMILHGRVRMGGGD